jgi:hypothetical protein
MFWFSALARNHALLESSYMSSWLTRPRRSPQVLRVILALISIVLPLQAIAMGGEEILLWIRYDHSNQYYYVEHWGLGHAKVFLLMGIIGLLTAGWVLFRRQASGQWLWLSMLVSLFLIWYPNWITFDGHYSGVFSGQSAEKRVRMSFRMFASEVRQAAEQGKPWHCTSGPTTTLSPYSRAGEQLFYQRVCVAADRPAASLLTSSRPGTIYIATGPDEKVVWLMATVLPRSASDTVMWVRGLSGEPLVLTRDRSFHDDWQQ